MKNDQNEFRLRWWKYGSQPDQPIRDVNPTVNSGGLFRTQSIPKPVSIPTNGRRPTSTIPIPISIKSQSVRNELKTGPTSVPETPLPSFPTSTTEQFTATPRRTYSRETNPTSFPKTDTTSVPDTALPTFSIPISKPVNKPDLRTDPTTVPKTQLPSSVPKFSRPGTKTSYTTDSQLPDQTIHPTTVPKTELPTFTKPESTRRSTRRPVTRSSVRTTTTTTTTTTKPRKVKIAFQIPLKSEKYDCNIFGLACKYRKQYEKLLQDAQGN